MSDAPSVDPTLPTVYVVGLRYPHHARHSGYEGFARYVGTPVPSPWPRRWLPGRVGRAIDSVMTAVSRRPRYALPVFLSEAAAALHMFVHPRSLYHVLYGDRDALVVPHAFSARGHRLLASFHLPPSEMAHSDYRWVRKIDAAILVSNTQRPFFERLLPSERIFVVQHGVDTSFFHPGRDRPPGREPVCVTVGSHLRDFQTLARTMRVLWRDSPGLRLVVVGLTASEESLHGGLDDDRVTIMDRLTDEGLRQVYRSASVGLFAFRDATTSIAVLEAMACGLPIVATNVGGLPEYVDRSAGILVAPGDAEALASGVRSLLEDVSFAARMGMAARREAERRDYRVIAQRMREVYLATHLRVGATSAVAE